MSKSQITTNLNTPESFIETSNEESKSVGLLSSVLSRSNKDQSFSFFEGQRAQLAKELYRNRRARSRLFDTELFSDPAWDILLILYCAHHAQQRLSVSSVCVAAAVPATTALRWIAHLSELEFVCKLPSPMDGRVTWLFLSSQARQRLDRYFDNVLDSRASLVSVQAAA